MMGIFLGAFVVNYLGGKSADIFMGNEKLAAGSDSDTVSTDTASSMVVENGRTGTTKGKRRAF
jgi:hypothetical protein